MINPLIKETLKRIWDTYRYQGKMALDTRAGQLKTLMKTDLLPSKTLRN